MAEVRGWPFSIGAGRRLDYRVIAAPGFLVESRDYGVLSDKVRPTDPAGPARVIPVSTPGGKQLTLAWATHTVSTADISGRRSEIGGGDHARDQQNRPLRLIYGLVIPGTWALAVDDSDLDTALIVALPTYREFLVNEEGFEVASTAAIELRSKAEQPAESGRFAAGPQIKGIKLSRALVMIAAIVVAIVVILGLRAGHSPPDCPDSSRSPSTTFPGQTLSC